MSDDDPAPDFAMARAVEILASIFEKSHKGSDVPPPPADKPIVLFNESISLDVNKTTADDVSKTLGIGFSYPAKGWHTYCVRGAGGKREFLSVFYSKKQLVSAELYYPKVGRAPNLQPVDLSFRFSPGELALGSNFTGLPAYFGRFSSAAEAMGAYATMFEARFPGGAAYAMGNNGIVERLAIYVHRGEATTTG